LVVWDGRSWDVDKTLFGYYDEMSYLLFSLIFLVPAIYYRKQWKKCDHQKKQYIKNQWQWQDWGE